MINKIKRSVLLLISVLVLSLSLNTFSVSAATSPKDAVCEGAGLISDGSGGCNNPTGSADVDTALEKALNLFSAIIGIVAVVMLMYGGLKFITSAGDSNSTNSARNTIIYAAVGLVIVALSQLIVRFVLSRFQ